MFKFNEYTKTTMSLELLKKRLEFQGGNQKQRMSKGKVKTLKKALLYSYQAETAILSDGREFRCLINPDKNKPDYDNKIISIPFQDICLNKKQIGKKTFEGQEIIGMKPGDVFVWKETNTHWLVFLQILNETAYFRSEIRRCDSQVFINGIPYWIYVRGPVETDIVWKQKANIDWNKMNYSLVIFITADENTNQFFSRFAKIKIKDPRDNKEKTWRVVGVNPYYGDGIIQIFAEEYFENEIEQAVKKLETVEQNNENPVDETAAYIDGPNKIQTYSVNNYTIKNATGGKWYLNWFGTQIDLNCSSDTLILENPSKQQGQTTLIYRIQEQDDIILNIKIVSL